MTQIIVENHDLQVRYHWSTNDLAICSFPFLLLSSSESTTPLADPAAHSHLQRWLMYLTGDNRSTFHSATFDFDAQEGEGGKRAGDRVCSLGEKAYFDPESVGRPA